MKKYLNMLGTFLLAMVIVDFLILLMTLLQVANGQPTEHIAFWDWQVRLVMGIFNFRY